MTVVLSLWKGRVERPTPPPRMGDIAEAVALRTGQTIEEMRSDTQARHVCQARDAAMALMFETGRFSHTQIGRYFGRCRFTVLKAIARHKARMTERSEAQAA